VSADKATSNADNAGELTERGNLTEANAIGGTIMRSELLDDATAQRIRPYLIHYLKQPIALVAADADDAARARSERGPR